jgi:hypothetical protein
MAKRKRWQEIPMELSLERLQSRNGEAARNDSHGHRLAIGGAPEQVAALRDASLAWGKARMGANGSARTA